MKKSSKFVGIGFYVLILFVALLMLIGTLISLINNFDAAWAVIMYLISLAAVALVSVFGIKGLKYILNNLSKDDTYEKKFVCGIVITFSSMFALISFIKLIMYLVNGNGISGEFVVVFLIQSAAFVLSVLSFISTVNKNHVILLLVATVLLLVITFISFDRYGLGCARDLFFIFGLFALIAYSVFSNLDAFEQNQAKEE